MKKTGGLWIDHEKAVIVFLAGNDADLLKRLGYDPED